MQYRHKVRQAGTRAKIADMALNGSGIRDTARVLGISPQTVMGELKKMEAVNQRPPVRPGYVPDPAAGLRLCADEMWAVV